MPVSKDEYILLQVKILLQGRYALEKSKLQKSQSSIKYGVVVPLVVRGKGSVSIDLLESRMDSSALVTIVSQATSSRGAATRL